MKTTRNTKYALVTGATSGIGKEIAIKLSQKGFCVIACGRNGKVLEKLKHQYGMIPYLCELTDEYERNSLLEFIKNKNITVAVNSAGVGNIGSFDEISDENDEASINLNIVALQLITKFLACNMKHGVILNVCSAAAFTPEPLMATYAATKAYVYAYSRAVDYELKKRKKPIRVLLLCPGAVNTPFISTAGAVKPAKGISAEKCAEEAIKAIFSKKSVTVPAFSMKVLRKLAKAVPEAIILEVQYRFQEAKLKK